MGAKLSKKRSYSAVKADKKAANEPVYVFQETEHFLSATKLRSHNSMPNIFLREKNNSRLKKSVSHYDIGAKYDSEDYDVPPSTNNQQWSNISEGGKSDDTLDSVDDYIDINEDYYDEVGNYLPEEHKPDVVDDNVDENQTEIKVSSRASSEKLQDIIYNLRITKKRIKTYDGKDNVAEIRASLDSALDGVEKIKSSNTTINALRNAISIKIKEYKQIITEKEQKYAPKKVEKPQNISSDTPNKQHFQSLADLFSKLTLKLDIIKENIIDYYGTSADDEYKSIMQELTDHIKVLRGIDCRGDVRLVLTTEQYEDYITRLQKQFEVIVADNERDFLAYKERLSTVDRNRNRRKRSQIIEDNCYVGQLPEGLEDSRQQWNSNQRISEEHADDEQDEAQDSKRNSAVNSNQRIGEENVGQEQEEVPPDFHEDIQSSTGSLSRRRKNNAITGSPSNSIDIQEFNSRQDDFVKNADLALMQNFDELGLGGDPHMRELIFGHHERFEEQEELPPNLDSRRNSRKNPQGKPKTGFNMFLDDESDEADEDTVNPEGFFSRSLSVNTEEEFYDCDDFEESDSSENANATNSVKRTDGGDFIAIDNNTENPDKSVHSTNSNKINPLSDKSDASDKVDEDNDDDKFYEAEDGFMIESNSKFENSFAESSKKAFNEAHGHTLLPHEDKTSDSSSTNEHNICSQNEEILCNNSSRKDSKTHLTEKTDEIETIINKTSETVEYWDEQVSDSESTDDSTNTNLAKEAVKVETHENKELEDTLVDWDEQNNYSEPISESSSTNLAKEIAKVETHKNKELVDTLVNWDEQESYYEPIHDSTSTNPAEELVQVKNKQTKLVETQSALDEQESCSDGQEQIEYFEESMHTLTTKVKDAVHECFNTDINSTVTKPILSDNAFYEDKKESNHNEESNDKTEIDYEIAISLPEVKQSNFQSPFSDSIYPDVVREADQKKVNDRYDYENSHQINAANKNNAQNLEIFSSTKVVADFVQNINTAEPTRRSQNSDVNGLSNETHAKAETINGKSGSRKNYDNAKDDLKLEEDSRGFYHDTIDDYSNNCLTIDADNSAQNVHKFNDDLRSKFQENSESCNSNEISETVKRHENMENDINNTEKNESDYAEDTSRKVESSNGNSIQVFSSQEESDAPSQCDNAKLDNKIGTNNNQPMVSINYSKEVEGHNSNAEQENIISQQKVIDSKYIENPEVSKGDFENNTDNIKKCELENNVLGNTLNNQPVVNLDIQFLDRSINNQKVNKIKYKSNSEEDTQDGSFPRTANIDVTTSLHNTINNPSSATFNAESVASSATNTTPDSIEDSFNDANEITLTDSSSGYADVGIKHSKYVENMNTSGDVNANVLGKSVVRNPAKLDNVKNAQEAEEAVLSLQPLKPTKDDETFSDEERDVVPELGSIHSRSRHNSHRDRIIDNLKPSSSKVDSYIDDYHDIQSHVKFEEEDLLEEERHSFPELTPITKLHKQVPSKPERSRTLHNEEKKKPSLEGRRLQFSNEPLHVETHFSPLEDNSTLVKTPTDEYFLDEERDTVPELVIASPPKRVDNETQNKLDTVMDCLDDMKLCVEEFEGSKSDEEYQNIYENLFKSMSILNKIKSSNGDIIKQKQHILQVINVCMGTLEDKAE